MMKTAGTAIVFWILLHISAVLAASPASALDAADVHVRAEDGRIWSVNRDTMVRLPEDVVSFWTRIIPRKGSELYERQQSVLKRAGKDPRRLEYYQRLAEVDCANGRLRVLTELHFDEKDRILLSRPAPRPRWKDIQAGSDDQLLRDAVCPDTAPLAKAKSAGLLLLAEK